MKHTKGQSMPDGTIQYYKDAMGRAMISSEYDPTSSYAVGDYCIYDNVRYVCNTAIASGGETWNSAHWDVDKVDDDISALNRNLSNLIKYVLIQGTTSTSGALALPTAVANGLIIDMYYEGSGVNGFINRRDKNYLTCYDNNLNIKASTAVEIHCYYTPTP